MERLRLRLVLVLLVGNYSVSLVSAGDQATDVVVDDVNSAPVAVKEAEEMFTTSQMTNQSDVNLMSTVTNVCASSNDGGNSSTSECQTTQPDGQTGGSSGGGSSSSRRRGYNGRISKAYYDSVMKILDPVRFSIHVLSVPILTLTIVSFAREKSITVSNSFVLAINLFEALAAIFNAVYYCMKYSMEPTAKVYIIWVLICNYGIVSCRRIVYIFNLMLCVQRLMAIVSPIKSRHIFTKAWRNWTFGAVISAMFLAHVYLAMMYIPKHLGNDVYIMSRSSYYLNDEFLFDCLGYVAKSLFSYIPLLLSLLVNFILIVFLKRHNLRTKKIRTTKDEEAKNKQERQMTLMIIVSTVAFTIMSLPSNINQMVSTIVEDYGTAKNDHYLYSIIKGGANAIQSVGDLTNFASYALLSPTFRRQVLLTLMCTTFDKKKALPSRYTDNTGLQSSSQGKDESSVTT